MKKGEVTKWANRPAKKRVLLSFVEPNTPKDVEIKLSLKKLKIRPFVERGLIILINPDAVKGRLYVLTAKGRRVLDLPIQGKTLRICDWAIIGWIKASPLQRLVLLKSVDSVKRTSEEIRTRASKYNSRMTRISVKGVLKEMIREGLVETELCNRRRLYWISKEGRLIAQALLKRE